MDFSGSYGFATTCVRNQLGKQFLSLEQKIHSDSQRVKCLAAFVGGLPLCVICVICNIRNAATWWRSGRCGGLRRRGCTRQMGRLAPGGADAGGASPPSCRAIRTSPCPTLAASDRGRGLDSPTYGSSEPRERPQPREAPVPTVGGT